MDYWKEIVVAFFALIGGIIMVWKFLSTFLTKASHEKMCDDRTELMETKIELAVVKGVNAGMTEWLDKNGHRLKG